MPRRRLLIPPLLAALLLAAACTRRGDARHALEGPPQRIVAGSVFSAEVLCEIAPRERLAARNKAHDEGAWVRAAAEAYAAKRRSTGAAA